MICDKKFHWSLIINVMNVFVMVVQCLLCAIAKKTFTHFSAQKMVFSVKYFFSKCEQIRRKPKSHFGMGCLINLLYIFRTPFSRSTSGGLLLKEEQLLRELASFSSFKPFGFGIQSHFGSGSKNVLPP